DTVQDLQPAFLQWAVADIQDAVGDGLAESQSGVRSMVISAALRVNGVLRVLCHLFRVIEHTEALDRHVDCLMDIFHSDAFEQHALTRKLIAKAAQRLALVYLPGASGAQTTGRHTQASLVSNLAGVSDPGAEEPGPADGDGASDIDEEECDVEIPEQVETFVGILLQKLHDK
ncbi:hypothetical protein EC988_008034, partial [Linderina pennispora]